MSKFKVYNFYYKGFFLPGTIMVVSSSEEIAFEIAKATIIIEGHNPDTLKLNTVHDIIANAVVYNWNGDY